MPIASFQPPRTALSAGAKLPSGVAVRPGRLVIAGNSNAKPYRGFRRINADQGGSAAKTKCVRLSMWRRTCRTRQRLLRASGSECAGPNGWAGVDWRGAHDKSLWRAWTAPERITGDQGQLVVGSQCKQRSILRLDHANQVHRIS